MLLLGMGWMVYAHSLCPVGGMFVLLYCMWHARRHVEHRRKRMGCYLLLIVCFLAGVLRGCYSNQQYQTYRNFLVDGGSVTFQGKIYKKESKAQTPVYYLQDVILQHEGEQIRCPSILIYPESDEDPIGTIYFGTGRVSLFRSAKNEGNFDEERYYRSLGITTRLTSVRVRQKISCNWSMAQKLYELRCAMAQIYARWLPEQESVVMAALALGEKGSLEEDIKQQYRTAGLSHILAISGLHISVVGMAVYSFLRRRGMRFVLAGLLSGTMVVCYGVMCGMGISTRRAIGMYLVYLLANVLGDAYDSLSALALAAAILAWSEPFCLQNTGAIFSFGAVLGVVSEASVMVAKVRQVRLQRLEKERRTIHDVGWMQRRWYEVVDALVMSLGIQLYTLPLVACFYYEIPVYSLIFNILLLPFLGLLLGFGLMGGLIGCLSVSLGGLPGGVLFSAARLFLIPCHLILSLFSLMTTMAEELPGAMQIVGCPSVWQMLLYYSVLYALCYGKRPVDCRIFHRRLFLWGMIVMTNVGVLFFPKRSRFEVVMLDVGQGDAIYIQSAAGGHFFIDGGSSDVNQVGQYRILSFLKYRGVRHIDYWFVSHADSDHISGLLECLEQGYDIRTIVLSQEIVESDGLQQLRQMAQERGISICNLEAGDTLYSGEMTMRCVYPVAEVEAEERLDANAMSMVLLLSYQDVRALFTGDLGSAQEKYLPMEQLNGINVLKVAHHGSAYSTSEDFLSETTPAYALISCGEDNSYGHPHEALLERLKVAGAEALCTEESGAIEMEIVGEKIVVSGYR